MLYLTHFRGAISEPIDEAHRTCHVSSRGLVSGKPKLNIKLWAQKLKRDIIALWIAARDRRVSRAAKIVAGATAAYALSPIDLIPDFIPVLGYLDDLLIVPAGIWLALRLIPTPLMQEFRIAASKHAERPISTIAAGAIVVLWLAFAILIWRVM
jgi:uncharacterized membrane protein YkvA (DUF1232 family)